MVLALVVSLIALALGRSVLGLVRCTDLNAGERLALAGALGFGSIAYLVFLLGLLGLFHRAVAYALLLGLAILLHRQFGAVFVDLAFSVRGAWRMALASASNRFLIAILALHLGLNFVATLAPPSAGDAMRYHLPVPQAYIYEHHVFFIPHAQFNLAAAAEMLFALSMLLRSDQVANILSGIPGLLAVVGTYGLASRYLGRRAGLWAALLFYGSPWVTNVADIKNDLMWTLATLAAIIALTHYLQGDGGRWGLLGGVFLGLGAWTKYQGLNVMAGAGLALLVVVVIVQRHAGDRRRTLLHLIAVGVLAGVVASPWYLRNWLAAGDPFWPLGYPFFHGRFMDEELLQRIRTMDTVSKYGHTPLSFLLGPWFGTVQPAFEISRRNPTNVVFLAFIPGLVIVWRSWELRTRQVLGWLLSVCAGYYVFWWITYQEPRYWISICPLLAIAAAAVVVRIFEEACWRRLIPLAALVLAVAFNLFGCFIRQSQFVPVVLGFQSRQAFLEENLTLYSSMQAANRLVPPRQTILTFHANDYYLRYPKINAALLSQSYWLRNQDYSSAETFLRRLDQLGVDYVLYDSLFARSLGGYLKGKGSQPDLQTNIFEALENAECLVPVYEGSDHLVESRALDQSVPIDHVILYRVENVDHCSLSLAGRTD